VGGQWQDSTTCVDDDVCTNGTTQPGTTPCGLNGNGLLDEECVGGQWQDSTTCVDNDVCTNGDTQPGTTPCGNGSGVYQQECINGQWVDDTNDCVGCVPTEDCETEGIVCGSFVDDCGDTIPLCGTCPGAGDPPENTECAADQLSCEAGLPVFTCTPMDYGQLSCMDLVVADGWTQTTADAHCQDSNNSCDCGSGQQACCTADQINPTCAQLGVPVCTTVSVITATRVAEADSCKDTTVEPKRCNNTLGGHTNYLYLPTAFPNTVCTGEAFNYGTIEYAPWPAY
jgi:hypothetical protein